MPIGQATQFVLTPTPENGGTPVYEPPTYQPLTPPVTEPPIYQPPGNGIPAPPSNDMIPPLYRPPENDIPIPPNGNGQNFIDQLIQKAKDNPLMAAGIAFLLFRVARNIL